MSGTAIPISEKLSLLNERRYIRIDTVFPVEMKFFDPGGGSSSHFFQAFCRNVGQDGLCLELNALDAELEPFLHLPDIKLDLQIEPPFTKKAIHARASLRWKKRQEGELIHYLVGAQYEQINDKDRRRLKRYALGRKWLPGLSLFLTLTLSVSVLFLSLYQLDLARTNQYLTAQVMTLTGYRAGVLSVLNGFGDAWRNVSRDLGINPEKVNDLVRVLSSASLIDQLKEKLEYERSTLLKERESYLADLRDFSEAPPRSRANEAASSEGRDVFPAPNVQLFYQWLTRHQHPQTGLAPSYEGDPKLENWSFTYDQALLVQVYTLFGNYDAAKKILLFFRDHAPQDKGAFVTTYITHSGSAKEWEVISGPNIWLGISALQYQKRSGDKSFEGLAVSLGNWLLALQNEDTEKGVKGGPGLTWYGTEHNLDAYSFYNMLYEVTKNKKFLTAREDVFNWLMKHAYDPNAARFRRGKGDATIATDTLTWAIAALGPARLEQVQFDPDGIMEFAEEHCRVTADFTQPDGKVVKVTGFDFVKPAALGRQGVVSTEWTAQAVVAYRLLADHYESKNKTWRARAYRKKAKFYLGELDKMKTSSLSRTGQGKGCLPYASAPNADTGHGWKVPDGHRTGSIAGTAYAVFAWLGYNPFDLNQSIDLPK
ncbi:MAG: PilZ domain-containing protein [Elusimicrobia bacterium]|nr:PilZ domain-containing protein [Elusimicrobiota bacterium]